MYLQTKYLSTVLGKGPIRLLTYREKDLLLAANRTSGLVFLKRGVSSRDGLVTLFMITPGLSKTRPHGNTCTHIARHIHLMQLIACILTHTINLKHHCWLALLWHYCGIVALMFCKCNFHAMVKKARK